MTILHGWIFWRRDHEDGRPTSSGADQKPKQAARVAEWLLDTSGRFRGPRQPCGTPQKASSGGKSRRE
jgi:hypothetical protein